MTPSSRRANRRANRRKTRAKTHTILQYLLLTMLQSPSCQAVPDHQRLGQSQRADIAEGVPQLLAARVAVEAPSPGLVVNTAGIGNFLSETPVPVLTQAVPSGTAQILPSLSGIRPGTSGSVPTSLETAGRTSRAPILTDYIPSPTSIITATSSTVNASPSKFNRPSMMAANIFDAPIGVGPPPGSIAQRNDHPAPRLGVVSSAPISTNKFYANFFLGNQNAATWLHPYSVTWAKGQGVTNSWGLAVSHIESSQRVFGPTNAYGDNQYFINPLGIQSLVLSAAELGPSTSLTTDKLTDMSAEVQLRPDAAAAPIIRFPVIQGAGFVTAIYTDATPSIQSGVFFRSVTKVSQEFRMDVIKYKVVLEDGHTWLIYAFSTSGYPFELQVINHGLARATNRFTGVIQVAKDPNGNGEAVYDGSCGAYATGVTLSGTAQSMRGTYTFAFQKSGISDAPLLMFALPHHLDSFDATTAASVNTCVQLQTTTKGVATAVVAESWTMVEPRLPISMSFLPWSDAKGSLNVLSAVARERIRAVAQQELSQDMLELTNQDSMYFSGKALAKFAMIISVVYDVLDDKALAAEGLVRLKQAFGRFASNQQHYPLVYESAWGGVVSTASYVTGNSGSDFGNTYYNDHHFHYGYHVLAAAVIGHVDPSWISGNKPYVDTLLRDYANPTAQDGWFPVNRNFDWFHGHSWAHGLYETLDGKDQESSSEDMMAAYAMKMWGLVSGDPDMAARGNLQLAVLARALNFYYLYTSTNMVQPSTFIGNKVAGILFENKIDHTTYFGANIEYIQGINMIPLLPCSKLVRHETFVEEEWARFFSNGRVDQVSGGWRGILYGNLATIQPQMAWNWFNQSNFDASWLDGGASLTWYLAYSAALGGL